MRGLGGTDMRHYETQWVDEKTLKISGIIDEYTDLIDTMASLPEEVWIDLSEISRVNSLGIREWARALATTTAKIHYVGCPSLIIDQFNMIPQLFGNNAQVDSFELCFCCDHCEFEESITYEIKERNEEEKAKLEQMTMPCLRCNHDMLLNHDTDLYFSFLNIPK